MISINNFKISKKNKPFIIAEMSGNHNNSLDNALKIVEEAAKSGADAIKIQTYTANTMTLNIKSKDFKIKDKNSLWYGKNLYDLYEEAHTPWEWHKHIFQKAKDMGIICFSTPFDDTSVDFLENLNVPAYKISSFENMDVNLIKKVCQTNKPIIISTGMSSLDDIFFIVKTLKKYKCKKYILLKCTSSYPALPKDINLKNIPHMLEMFNCPIGLSDHTNGIGVSLAAVALGANVIEKHFCLSRNLGGVDSKFSLEPYEFKLLVEESKKVWESIGTVNYFINKREKKSKQFKRSIYFSKAMKIGDVITKEHIKCIRPGYGLHPKYWYNVIGKIVNKNINIGDRVTFSKLLNSKENHINDI